MRNKNLTMMALFALAIAGCATAGKPIQKGDEETEGPGAAPAATAAAAKNESAPKPPSDAAIQAQKKAAPGRLAKLIATENGQTAVAYWGGRVEVYGKGGALRAAHSFVQDVTALAWAGRRLIVGDADGRLTALDVK